MAHIDGPVILPVAPPDVIEFLRISLQPIPVLPVIGTLLTLLYVAGAASMWARHRRWPVWRSIAFLTGSVGLTWLTASGAEGYGFGMFSVFMFQQLTIMFVIGPLLVLGSPGMLLLRALPKTGPGQSIRKAAHVVMHSRIYGWLLHPGFTLPLFLLLFYGLYLGGFANALLGSLTGHLSLEIAFLVSGILFAAPILGDDPMPIRLSPAARIVDVFFEMALHAFFGVILMMSPNVVIDVFQNPPASWGVDPLADQQLAGGLAWSYGEGPTIIIFVYLLHRWFVTDTRRAARRDRSVDRDGDTELEAYNEYLARLRSNRPPKGP